jgi:hypothetical protein
MMSVDGMDELLRGIRDGLIRNPGQIVLLLFLVLVCVSAVFLFNFLLRRKETQHYRDTVDNLFGRYCHQYDLTQREVHLVDRMSQYLKDPRKKYLLLINQQTFLACFHTFKQAETFPKEEMLSLLTKLGFRFHDKHRHPKSSRDLNPGTPAVLLTSKDKTYNGHVARQMDNSVVFFLPEPPRIIDLEGPLQLIVHDFSGLFEFDTHLQKISGSDCLLAHSDQVKKIQRREYYRKKLTIPIHIRKEGFPEDMDDQTQILDLSLGGMSVVNPERKYRAGDDISLYFYKGAHSVFHLYGEVIRVTNNRKILHIKFGHFNSNEQDRISAIMNAGRL